MHGKLQSIYENALFIMADNFLKDYHGGHWAKRKVKLFGGFFWYLKEKGKFNVSTAGGNFAENVTAEFAGLVLSFQALHYILEKVAQNDGYELYKGFFVKINEADYKYILNLIESLKDYAANKGGKFAQEFFKIID